MQLTTTGADLELPEDKDLRRRVIKNHYPCEIICPKCSGVAFFYRTTPVRGREFQSGEALNIEGEHPTRLDPVKCGSCGAKFKPEEAYWRGKT